MYLMGKAAWGMICAIEAKNVARGSDQLFHKKENIHELS